MPNPRPRPPDEAFTATRWSMATRAFGAAQANSAQALEELGSRYRYPVYAYLRSCGHAPAIAQDIAGCFLRDLHSFLAKGEPPQQDEHFRHFLIGRLRPWLAGDWHQLLVGNDGDAPAPDATLEERRARDRRAADSPDEAFQRAFALEVLGRALARLRREARQTGHLDMYLALVPLLGHDPEPGQCDEIARSLRVRPLTLVVALKRLRQRLRELASEELADTVVRADDLAGERQALLSILQSAG